MLRLIWGLCWPNFGFMPVPKPVAVASGRWCFDWPSPNYVGTHRAWEWVNPKLPIHWEWGEVVRYEKRAWYDEQKDDWMLGQQEHTIFHDQEETLCHGVRVADYATLTTSLVTAAIFTAPQCSFINARAQVYFFKKSKLMSVGSLWHSWAQQDLYKKH